MERYLLPAYFTVIAIYLITCFIIGRRRRKRAAASSYSQGGICDHGHAKPEKPGEVPQTVGLWKPYGEAELLADLHNPALSIDEIMVRCKDMDPALVEKTVKSMSPDDRRAQRLLWYTTMLKSNKVLKVVPPPAPAKTVIAVKASMEICRMCPHERVTIGGYNLDPSNPYRRIIGCKFCKDTGYVTIQRG